MSTRLIATLVSMFAAAQADTIVLKSGKTVEGTYLGGSSRQIRFAVGERVEVFDLAAVSELRFGASEPEEDAPPPLRRRQKVEILRPERTAAASAPARQSTLIPEGTNLVIRMIDDVDSERDRVGQTYKAAMDEAVVVNGETVIARGADVVVRLIDDKESGKLSGRAELTLDIETITVNGKPVDVKTQGVTSASESRTGRTGKVVGGGAALGAIIGAIAGGGKGAAVGAATGAGAGAAVQVLTKGQRVRIPSETKLTFALRQAINL